MPLAWGITKVPDNHGRLTTILYRPSERVRERKTVVFFPGDISDFAFSHRHDALFDYLPDAHNYKYSLENICWEISSRVPSDFAVVVCKPAFMMGCSSVFANFLPCDITGCPRWGDIDRFELESCPGKVLMQILVHVSGLIHAREGDEDIRLFGFSKGCVVLSGILRERNVDLLRLTKAICFIDPGLHVDRSTFAIGKSDFESFPCIIPINVWVSPYQLCDPQRPWLKEEIQDFAANNMCEMHFILTEHARSLETHFRSIQVAFENTFKSKYVFLKFPSTVSISFQNSDYILTWTYLHYH